MRFAELGLKMGDVMQLQIAADSDTRYPVKLLGFLPDCSVMISAPEDSKDKIIILEDERIVTLRFVVNNVSSGFSAKVLASRTHPKPYLHLEMPKQVKAVEVRSAVRVNVDFPATIVNDTRSDQSLTVQMTNLSVLGGKFQSDNKIALVGDALTLSLCLRLDDIEKHVTLECEIRNKGQISGGNEIQSDANTLDENATAHGLNWYGFDFKFTDTEARLLLKAFVYQEILRSIHLL